MNLSDIVSQENIDKKIEIEDAVENLSHVERAILYLWVEGYTQAEIAHIFGYCQQRISQIIANISKTTQKVAVDCRNYVDE